MARISGHGQRADLAMAAAMVALSIAGLQPANADNRLTGGPSGVVKSSKGELLEGMMVQLIAKKSAVRTTVYSDANGRYEFPALDAGAYALRIAQPRSSSRSSRKRSRSRAASCRRRVCALNGGAR